MASVCYFLIPNTVESAHFLTPDEKLLARELIILGSPTKVDEQGYVPFSHVSTFISDSSSYHNVKVIELQKLKTSLGQKFVAVSSISVRPGLYKPVERSHL